MKISILLIIILGVYFTANIVKAEDSDEIKKVDYKNEVIVDSDLDGLTDKGEQQLYGTDPSNLDSDNDSYLDGAEVLSGTDPLDGADYPGHRAADIAQIRAVTGAEIPWVWYVARAAGLLGFVFLWLTIFLGLSIRNPWLKKIIEPIYSFDFHCFTAAVAVFWALVHGTSLLFDPLIGFGVKDIAIPFYLQSELVHTNALALGILAFYAMAIMTVTSYLRNHMSHWLWRALHFLNPLAFIFVVTHGYKLGTDMKNFYAGSAFLFSSFLLALIYLSSLVFVIINKMRKKDEYPN